MAKRKSLVSKLNLLSILLILLAASSVACFVVYEQTRKRQDILLDLGLQLANAIALASGPGLLERSPSALAKVLERSIAAEQVAYAAVLDSDRTVLTERSTRLRPPSLDWTDLRTLRGDVMYTLRRDPASWLGLSRYPRSGSLCGPQPAHATPTRPGRISCWAMCASG